RRLRLRPAARIPQRASHNAHLGRSTVRPGGGRVPHPAPCLPPGHLAPATFRLPTLPLPACPRHRNASRLSTNATAAALRSMPVGPLTATLAVQTLATMALYSVPAMAPEVARNLGVSGTLVGGFV